MKPFTWGGLEILGNHCWIMENPCSGLSHCNSTFKSNVASGYFTTNTAVKQWNTVNAKAAYFHSFNVSSRCWQWLILREKKWCCAGEGREGVLNKIVSSDRVKAVCVAKHRSTGNSTEITVNCLHFAHFVKHDITYSVEYRSVAKFYCQHKQTDQHKATKISSRAIDIYSYLQSNSYCRSDTLTEVSSNTRIFRDVRTYIHTYVYARARTHTHTPPPHTHHTPTHPPHTHTTHTHPTHTRTTHTHHTHTPHTHTRTTHTHHTQRIRL
jgi:hypothetical protein